MTHLDHSFLYSFGSCNVWVLTFRQKRSNPYLAEVALAPITLNIRFVTSKVVFVTETFAVAMTVPHSPRSCAVNMTFLFPIHSAGHQPPVGLMLQKPLIERIYSIMANRIRAIFRLILM